MLARHEVTLHRVRLPGSPRYRFRMTAFDYMWFGTCATLIVVSAVVRWLIGRKVEWV